MLWQAVSRNRLGFADPFHEMNYEMNRLQNQLNKLFDGSSGRRDADFPPLNIWTSEDNIMIKCPMPGVSAEDVEISVLADTMSLRGQRTVEEPPAGGSLQRRERHCGQFTRTIQLPFRVDAEKVEAVFKKGVLQIKLPRSAQDKPRKITVCSQ